METPRSQTKVAMNYGIMLGLSAIIISLLFYFLNTNLQSKLPMLFSFSAMLAIIVTGTKSYRDNDLGGFISYGRSLGTGTLIALFGGIIAAAYTFVFFNYIDPDMIAKITAMAQQNLADSGLSDEMIEKQMSMMRVFMTPGWMLVFTILQYIFVGFVMSLIISIFTRKEQDPFNSNIG